MRKRKTYQLTDNFLSHFLEWGNSFSHFTILDSKEYYENSNSKTDYHSFKIIAAVDFIAEIAIDTANSFEALKIFYNNKKDWLFGFFTYDLKNETENLKSENIDRLEFPQIHFYQPKFVFIFSDKSVDILFDSSVSDDSADLIFNEISNVKLRFPTENLSYKVQTRFTKEEYISVVNKLIDNIKLGNIYEINFCQEFYIEDIIVNPIDLYVKLTTISPMPFSCFYKLHDKYIICASPERYLKKTGNKLISQPIKGTKRRGKTKQEDLILQNNLITDEKEIAENIMIADLVRNDLSRTAKNNSVIAEELCTLNSFQQVHQLISTIVSELDNQYHFVDAIKNSFPMGSMTGAPKIRAMELIEKYEKTKRGLYSGSIGYITPDADFDFNVVIRSILYNTQNYYLSFSVGGAITAKSDPEKEYEECLVKADAIMKLLSPIIN